MRRAVIAAGLALSLPAVAACGTMGQPTHFDMAELTARCDQRGGDLIPTGAQTGRPQTDFICQSATDRVVVNREPARTSLNVAVSQSLAGGR